MAILCNIYNIMIYLLKYFFLLRESGLVLMLNKIINIKVRDNGNKFTLSINFLYDPLNSFKNQTRMQFKKDIYLQ